MDFEARVERRDTGAHGPGSLVEIRYRPDLGPVGSFIAAHLIPQLSFWFDPTTANSSGRAPDPALLAGTRGDRGARRGSDPAG